ncbi:threonine--tRNA ligase 1, cytoplasmic-like isoform X2 [Homalodisca vitripennis]|uniref:threonine--tRNA ligase 1, cytoplasmic-like isoform X2 n=1 Tax=Homalodisca vitripennis TaxID=197043 RepID=UPI001EEAD97C|nr:threonine--tRNA ligase 1, cytoplasmic-like isoform X2 [Homalodisca vitripennis]XP_046661415.1 threonine--tRNA ligase 1, cytoplasmic-like isoform X2 [Homalodisca vitripennis]XP_046661416.1 threonine--tRNA ligase 1, cytoplasmic-like isoform X2 [Homalodisca vitripennis]XP_046661417.1 threonine--tRNA ligase 1, cytoplasmic-like isoform X2 [Homalodisca vitripennis]
MSDTIKLADLNSYLAENSYIAGFQPSQNDKIVFEHLKGQSIQQFSHIARWYNHILSFGSNRDKFPEAVEGLITSFNITSLKGSKIENQSFRLPLVPGMSRPSPVTELSPWPSYIEDRIIMWDRLKVQYAEELARKVPEDITVTLPDGKELPAQSWRTTPYEIAMGISFGLADNVVSCKVNNVLWDLERPLEESCKLELLKFDNPEAEQVFWHSSAHILGEAMERMYGGYLCYGPPIESGFYYDMHMPNTQVSNIDFPVVENIMKTIVKERQPFERLEMKKEDLLEMFKYNEFKQRILKEKVTTPTTTVYRCGSLIDLCRGPHIRHTGKVKAFKITKNSATYWEGKSDAESLQRIYGIAFPDNKKMKEWEKFQEEAAKRDHRKLGREQELYFFHELSPGSCFFQPRGAHIYNKLIEFIRSEYRKRGFQEVVTPNIFNAKLWQTSGHWEHYADNMFSFDVEKEMFALKPMNCPGHCLVFDHRPRSWRELPLRMADFGVLHRNELSGALTGLTRVRRFQQDDAHIFCAVPQIKAEITGALDFLRHVYGVFGFTFQLCLSTRPDKFLGDIAVWEEAEKQLADSLNDFGEPWRENPGDGAFYGPKIDITIMDALRRNHQCATIQLDFQLPIRFNLAYINEAGEKTRPVIIHRAILGSVERMIAILTESYAGKWPFWLSPRQIMIIPVGPPFNDYAEKVKDQLYNAGFVCEVDSDAGDTMNKKIRNAQLAQYNFILVVGEREQTAETVNVRTRDNVIHGELNIPDLISKFRLLTEKRSSEDVF